MTSCGFAWQPYEFRLRAVNAKGKSGWSRPKTIQTGPMGPEDAPGRAARPSTAPASGSPAPAAASSSSSSSKPSNRGMPPRSFSARDKFRDDSDSDSTTPPVARSHPARPQSAATHRRRASEAAPASSRSKPGAAWSASGWGGEDGTRVSLLLFFLLFLCRGFARPAFILHDTLPSHRLRFRSRMVAVSRASVVERRHRRHGVLRGTHGPVVWVPVLGVQ